MQSKVQSTRMHKTTNVKYNKTLVMNFYEEVPVAEGKLIFVDTHFTQHHEPGFIHKFSSKPIIISETEVIEVGDWFYDSVQNSIKLCEDVNRFTLNLTVNNPQFIKKCYKILVLPEQFSPKHLQAIVDGKMKEGESVLVECGKLEWKDMEPPYQKEFQIKLTNEHVTLHKVVEKMYSKEEVVKLFEAFFEYCNNESDSQWWFEIQSEKWLEQNVK